MAHPPRKLFVLSLNNLVSGTSVQIPPQLNADGTPTGKTIGLSNVNVFGTGATSSTSAFSMTLAFRKRNPTTGVADNVVMFNLVNKIGEILNFDPHDDVDFGVCEVWVRGAFSNAGDGTAGTVIFTYLP